MKETEVNGIDKGRGQNRLRSERREKKLITKRSESLNTIDGENERRGQTPDAALKW